MSKDASLTALIKIVLQDSCITDVGPQEILRQTSSLKSEIRKHSKSRLLEGRISNGLYVVGFQVVPPIQNQKIVYTKKQSWINEPFKIQTI